MDLLPRVQVNLATGSQRLPDTSDLKSSLYQNCNFKAGEAVPGTTEKLTATPTDYLEPLAKLVLSVKLEKSNDTVNFKSPLLKHNEIRK